MKDDAVGNSSEVQYLSTISMSFLYNFCRAIRCRYIRWSAETERMVVNMYDHHSSI